MAALSTRQRLKLELLDQRDGDRAARTWFGCDGAEKLMAEVVFASSHGRGEQAVPRMSWLVYQGKGH